MLTFLFNYKRDCGQREVNVVHTHLCRPLPPREDALERGL